MDIITTFLDKRDMRQLARSSEIRKVSSAKGAAKALSYFLYEVELGYDPPLLKVNPENDYLLSVEIGALTRLHINNLISETDFTPEDVIVSSVNRMIYWDHVEVRESTRIELEVIILERARLNEQFRDITD